MREVRVLLCIIIVMVFGLAGCMKGEQTMEEVDVPENVSIVDEEANENNDEQINEAEDEAVIESEETVARELYLIDENGMVVPETLELPKSESAAKQVLEYLVKDGPVTELLPNGFEAVLPAGTEILGVNLEEEGTLIVDVSKEFQEYQAEDELKILQAMTHTLTQFESVDKIKLWINGHNLTEMPVNGTPLSDGYSRANGINLDVTERPDVQSTEAATVFYPKKYESGLKFVPMTKYISRAEKEDYFASVVQAMLDGPSYSYVVQDVFNDQTTLVKKPYLKDGVLQLEFSDAILENKEKQTISDETVETLVRTLTAQEGVDAVQLTVENVEELSGKNGVSYNEPVTVQSFESKEKM